MVRQLIIFTRNLAVLGLLLLPFLFSAAPALAVTADPVGLTPDQLQACKDKWGGDRYNLSRPAQLENYNQFKASKCNAANDKGGNCSAETHREVSESGAKETIAVITCGAVDDGGAVTSDDLEDLSDPALTSTECTSDATSTGDAGEPNDCGFVEKYINPFIKLLSIVVGVVAIIFIIFGAIQVISSAGDPQKSANGKEHIRNALIGLVAFLILAAVLRWLVLPGAIN